MNFDHIVLVMRVADLEPAIAKITKSTKTQCSFCGEDVWISEGLREVAPPDAAMLCNICLTHFGKGADA